MNIIMIEANKKRPCKETRTCCPRLLLVVLLVPQKHEEHDVGVSKWENYDTTEIQWVSVP